MQVSVLSQESASEVPVDNDTRNLERNFSFNSMLTSLGCSRIESTPAGKGPPDPAKSQENAEESPQASRIKRKAKDKRKDVAVIEKRQFIKEVHIKVNEVGSDMSACFEDEILSKLREEDPDTNIVKEDLTVFDWLDGSFWALEDRLDRVKDTSEKDPYFSEDIDAVSRYIKEIDGGWEGESLKPLLEGKNGRLQDLIKTHKKVSVHPRARAVSSYKGRTSAKSHKGRKR